MIEKLKIMAIYDDFLVNINTVQDLKKAEDFIRGIEWKV